MAGQAGRWYLRIVFVLIGAALALSLALLDTTVIALLVQSTSLPIAVVAVLGTLLVVAPVVAVGLLPVTRTVEGVAVQSLLGVDLPHTTPGPARTWPQRRRTLGWFVLHLLAGVLVIGVVLGSMLTGRSWWTPVLLVTTVPTTVLLAVVLARWAPALLGPSPAERMALLEADVDAAAQRNRIAREIHDSVGHALSLITVQSAAARTVLDSDPQFAVSALGAIEDASRSAAAELDHVLGMLRDDRHAAAAAPDLTALDTLVRAIRAAGLTVHDTVDGELGSVPPAVSREAYRIIQEALTNALRYATDAAVTLAIRRAGRELRIVARNAAAPSTRTGRGLRGMGERVEALGGALRTGMTTDDVFELSAILRWEE